MPLGTTIPPLPVGDVPAATAFYAERLGFTCLHTDGHFSVLGRDGARIHLWESADTGWRGRSDLEARPVVSGAESFLAGTASCRIEVDNDGELDDLYLEMDAAGVLHGVSGAGVQATDYGARELHVLDLDGNLLTFYSWR